MVHNGLGYRDAIGRFARHVDVNYCYCIDEEESINHLSILCSRTRDILFSSDLNIRFDSNSAPSIQSLVAGWLMADDNYASFCYGANVLWSIWTARNKLIFDNKPSSIHKILHDARLIFTDYNKSNIMENLQSVSSLVSTSMDTAEPGIVKLNFDGVVHGFESGAAVVARYSSSFVLAATSSLHKQNFPVVAKIYGILLALQLAKMKGYDKLIIEGDCQQLIQYIQW